MKKLTIIASVFVLVASFAFAAAPSSANAMCSPNGYINSGGKCGQSFKWEKKEKKQDFNYSWKYGGNGYNTDYLQAYINHLLALLAALENANDDDDEDNNDGDVYVRTLGAIDINEDSATLRGAIDMRSEDEAELYFEYGDSVSDLDTDTARMTLDESDDDEVMEKTIDGLEDDTKYFFRAVAVDEDGEKDYGVIYSFFTDDSDDDDNDDVHPTVTTNAAEDVDTDSADLRGTVDMEDFENGVAFFVYGEDEDQIDDVEDDFNSYDDVDDDDEDLRKTLVDSDVDGTEAYEHTVTGLDENTNIYFALCVAFEDEDDDDTLECGTTRTFETN